MPEVQAQRGVFPLSASLLYLSFYLKSIPEIVKQMKVLLEVSFTHRNKVLKFTLLYKRKVITLNWP